MNSNYPLPKAKLQKKGFAGFSLAEVTLAVAITALGTLSLLGLLPQGMEMSRKSGMTAAETRMLQQISGELDLSDWSTLPLYGAGNNRVFDDQGLEIVDGNDDRTTYIVKVEIMANDVRLPGGQTANQNMVRAVIKIGASTNRNFPFTNTRLYNTYSMLVAKKTK